MIRLYALVLGLLTTAGASAQPANDDCADAIVLPEAMNYCSGAAAFTNVDATPSLEFDDYPTCIDERDEIRDVWFSFVALRNSVSIQVIGDEPGNSRGTLTAPQFALFSGSCGSPQGVACRSTFVAGGNTPNSGSLIFNELQRGETYYILVGARADRSGTFELCVNQFDAPPSPSSDCETAVILCDKSPFAVDFLQGRGNVLDDLQSENIDCQGRPEESNSAWYKWTCAEAGSLEFDITPLGSAFNEDIDFVLYELDSGLDDCGDRRPIRQMFSGENGGNPNSSVNCFGATGLGPRAEEGPIENCGCSPGDNNYVSFVDMEAGKSYALVIMNFTGSGDGFEIEFGGTGTFLGPEPNLTYSSAEVCVGDAVTFLDESTSVDGIESWDWDFGPTATPRFASGAGPHDVTFAEAGAPAITLAITSTRNCIEYISTTDVNVVCCSEQFTGVAEVSDVTCAGAGDGTIAFTGSSTVPGATLAYAWSNGATTATVAGLDPGSYTVTLTDGSGCEASYEYTVQGSSAFVLDTLITPPDCGGGTNGVLEFTILSGGAQPYEYSFNGGPFGPENRLENLAASTVTVRARDGQGCEIVQEIAVDELRLNILEGSAAFREPTCNGGADGQLVIELANGRAPYRYDFGEGLQGSQQRTGFAAGTYPVRAVDADGCTGDFNVTVTDPPLLETDLQVDSLSCYGVDDGTILATGLGGRPGYTYAWADGVDTNLRASLAAGTYVLTLTDSLGCSRQDSVTLTNPSEIVARIANQQDLVCAGDSIGFFTLAATGGTPEYAYSADGLIFQADTLLTGLSAGDYTLYVEDRNGCRDSLSGTLREPMPFVVDLMVEDARLFLGEDTVLQARANYFPVTYAWGPDSVTCLTPDCSRVRVMPLGPMKYFVTGTNAVGCVDTAVVAFTVIEDLGTYVPNAISPNGDDANDRFTVFGNRAIGYVEQLRVYDRWGGLLYEAPEPFPANDPAYGWDGTVDGQLVNSGVYVYYVQVRYLNGRLVGYRGDVTVLY
ncbi:gliding motility-associated C-terminal domain-containing protein [Lewinella sp. IMCC34183]|uniref:T9SS type B sorting domain-containing protein n=1 Tax=Lewinella sp. IMCC34183 TaxID=2248762 RepID=UPI0018E563A6|nr:gliding motility-associated C-terminal domain-containing protein [Lewinella sp. IMCC34183]